MFTLLGELERNERQPKCLVLDGICIVGIHEVRAIQGR